LKNWRRASDPDTVPYDDAAAPYDDAAAPYDDAAAPYDDAAAGPDLRSLPAAFGGGVIHRLPEGPVATTVRAVVRATPETFTLARHRAQPRAVYIARLTLTAIFAYLIARQVSGCRCWSGSRGGASAS
jgi:hypothetical protein